MSKEICEQTAVRVVTPRQPKDFQRPDALPAFRHAVDQGQEQADDHSEGEAHSHGLRSGRGKEEELRLL